MSEIVHFFHSFAVLPLCVCPCVCVNLCVCVCVCVCAVIQGILESVQWFRKLNTDEEGRRPGLEGVGGRGSQDTTE